MKDYVTPTIEIVSLDSEDILLNSPIEDTSSDWGDLIPMGARWS